MRFGFIIPGGDLETTIELAVEAEEAGWDGVFYWDGIYIESAGPIFDPWVTLGAMAMRTQRVRLGAIISPLARRRPWKVARETVTVDHLSHGRLTLAVGLGTLDDGGFSKVGEATGRKTRAELLDESLDILTGLWSGAPFSYAGKHYHLETMTFTPPPMQQPRIPIWVVGAWPRARSIERALRYDGILPALLNADGSFGEITPETISAIRERVIARRDSADSFDMVWEGETPGDAPAHAAEIVRPFAEAGATWWLESRWSAMRDSEIVRARIRQGPPRL